MFKYKQFLEIIKDEREKPITFEGKINLTDWKTLEATGKLVQRLGFLEKLYLLEILIKLNAFFISAVKLGLDDRQSNQMLKRNAKWGRRGDYVTGNAKLGYRKNEKNA